MNSENKMFDESQLVAFGNFLLKKHNVSYLYEGNPEDEREAKVTDPDLSNWQGI